MITLIQYNHTPAQSHILVKGESFTKLWRALVESVLLYGAEVWGCGRHATLMEQIQLRAARIFLGVGRLYPKAALQCEMKMMPVIWEAKRRCIEFWLTLLRMSDDRLVKRVVIESLEMAGKTAWQKDLECGLEGFGWRDVGIEGLGRLSIYDRNRTHAERHCVERGEEGVGG